MNIFTNSNFSIIALLLFVTICFDQVNGSILSDNNFSQEQRLLLRKIKVAARESGLPKSAWVNLTSKHFDHTLCYEVDCLESDFSVDPCSPNKWLDFVCKRRVAGSSHLNQLDQLREEVGKHTISLLKSGDSARNDDYLFREAQTFYHQCTERGMNDSRNIRYVLKFVESKNYGVWPILHSPLKPSKNFPWMSMVADENRVERLGFVPMFFHVSVPEDDPHIQLDIGQISCPYTVQSVSDYEKMMTYMHAEGGLTNFLDIRQVRSTLEYMSKINSKIMDGLPMRDLPKSNFTLEELQRETDHYFVNARLAIRVNWPLFFERTFRGTDIIFRKNSPKISLPFKPVMKIIQNVETELKHNGDSRGRVAIVNAMYFHLVSMSLQETTTLLDELNTFRCTDEPGSRENICFEKTLDIFGYSLGNTYLRKYYNDQQTTPQVEHLMSKIKQGYATWINRQSWLTPATKGALISKVNSIHVQIAQPSWLRDSAQLVKFFEGLSVDKNVNSSYPVNFLRANIWAVQKKRSWAHAKAVGTLNRIDVDWNVYLGLANAHYDILNQIRIYAGLLQKPIFGNGRPGFMNYGGLGMILGHEIGHSLDTTGRALNRIGKVGEFWDKTSLEGYNNWVSKIAKFYESIPHNITDTLVRNVNPKNTTLNEDIADVLGVTVSYHTYQEYLKELTRAGKREKVLPGLKLYSSRQLFFMKYGNMWCENVDVQSQFHQLGDDHSGGNRRATLPLMWSEEFKKTFGCNMQYISLPSTRA